MKLLLLALPLALIACVKPDCVVYVNGKPVYNQCYQDDGKDGGKNYSPPAADDNGGDSNNHGSDSNGDKSKDHSKDSNGDKSKDRSDDSNGGNSDGDDN
jgi:hypothetical protein